MPLMALTRDKHDEYANVKPFASCTVMFEASDDVDVTKANIKRMKEVVTEAFFEAQGIVYEQIQSFGADLQELYADKKGR